MGIMSIFSGGRNPITEIVGAFKPNAEATAQRAADQQSAALGQYAAEFGNDGGLIGSIANGLNRLVRPILVILIFWPVVETRVDPERATATWSALATVPEPYWWFLGAVVTFYFGGRMQVKSLNAKTFTAAATAVSGLVRATPVTENKALDDWKGSD